MIRLYIPRLLIPTVFRNYQINVPQRLKHLTPNIIWIKTLLTLKRIKLIR